MSLSKVINRPALALLGLALLSIAGFPCRADMTTAPLSKVDGVFGDSERKSGTLIGIFYDLKQTQRRAPVPDYARHYVPALDQFLVEGFDESLLNRFFRAARPLYTTQLWMPRMNADAAPRAFGVDGVVEPSYWVVHYKAQVAPPVGGTYRFVGNFDDVLVVAINRKVVLDGSLVGTHFRQLGWKQPEKGPPVAANKGSRYGDWIDLKAGKPVDIDILIGERPGGVFYGALLYEKKGAAYPRDAQGNVILPLFQLAERKEKEGIFLSDQPPWKCFE